MSLPESTKIYFTEIHIIFSSLLLIVFGYPLLLIFLLPCFIYKTLVIFCAKKDPKFGNTLDGISGVCAGQDPYLKPDMVLVPYYTLADKPNVPKVVEVINEKIIKPGLYPELTQKIVRKYGYHFWYSIDNFNVEDQIRYLNPDYPNTLVTRQELRVITRKLGRLPFDPEKSPWEILIVPNYICDRDPEAKSVLILRVNHCLMDGYALANLCSKCASKPFMDNLLGKFQNRHSKINQFKKLYQSIMLFLTGPYHLLKLIAFNADSHQFVKNVNNSNVEDKWNSQCTPPVSKARLKAITNGYGVSMSSLITTIFAQAFYKTMKQNKLTNRSNYIHGLITFPLPGHPGTMTNHWSTVRMPVNVNLQDTSKTLKFVDNQYKSVRGSVSPLVFPVCNKLSTIPPLCFRPASKPMLPTSFILTNFPGPEESVDMFGCRVRQVSLGGKGSSGTVSVFGSLSVHGNFWFMAGSPVCNLPNQEDADYLSEAILETLRDLERLNWTKNEKV